MSWSDQFPIEFDDADVTLERIMGDIEVVIEHESLDRPLAACVSPPDGVDEQLMNGGLIEL